MINASALTLKYWKLKCQINRQLADQGHDRKTNREIQWMNGYMMTE